MKAETWPDLGAPSLPDTLKTLHLWTQIVGKVKLAALPWLNASWHLPLYVSASGLTTDMVTHGGVAFEIVFDFVAGVLRLATSDGQRAYVPLAPMSVSEFHALVQDMLAGAGIAVALSPRPCEIEGALPFADDHESRIFDLTAAHAWWLTLIQVHRIFHRFRSRFVGKSSPIHMFWGSFDLAVTRFSGRAAPPAEQGGPNMSVAVARDAYAEEQMTCGFWPGGKGVAEPSFFVEAWPVPDGFADAKVGPAAARFEKTLNEWVLGYSSVFESIDPDATLLEFLQTGYAAVADKGRWARDRLERMEGPIGRPPLMDRHGGRHGA